MSYIKNYISHSLLSNNDDFCDGRIMSEADLMKTIGGGPLDDHGSGTKLEVGRQPNGQRDIFVGYESNNKVRVSTGVVHTIYGVPNVQVKYTPNCVIL